MDTRIPGSLDISRMAGAKRTIETDVSTQTPRSAEHSLAQKETARMDRAELETLVDEMNESVRSADRDIAFQLDDDSGRVVINVTERETGKVIRQIPSEEALALAEQLEQARSLLFKTEV